MNWLIFTTSEAHQPGTVVTDFFVEFRKNPLLNMLEKIMAISPAEGAATSVFLASEPSVEGVSGKYFIKKKEKKSSKASYDVEAAKKLWDISERLVELK